MAARDLESIYADNSRMVYWAAYGIVRNDSDAMDVSQNVFLKAIKHLSTLQGMDDAQLRGWLYRVAVNLCYDIKRREKRETPEEELPEQVSESVFDLPEASAILQDQKDRVRRAVDELPELYRETVLLHYFSGLNYEQIGALSGAAEGTVKSRIFRAKEKLYALLKEGEKND